MPHNTPMELLRIDSLLKLKFCKFLSVLNSSGIINFWQSLPGKYFPKLRKFSLNDICHFEMTHRCGYLWFRL